MTAEATTRVEVAVIGGGPGGLSAALVLSQARRDVVVIDAGLPRNRSAAHVHGLTGADGTPPGELLARGRCEVERYGGRVVTGRVVRVEQDATGCSLALAAGASLQARQVVLATGVTDTLPPVPGLAEMWGVDVHRCPFCHGCEVTGRPLVVLGVDAGSVHQALLVSQWSEEVTLVTHDLPRLSERTGLELAARGVRVIPGRVRALRPGSSSLRLRDVVLEDGTSIRSEAVFVMTRLVPSSGLAAELGCQLHDDGFVRTDPVGRTSRRGVWAVGNLTDPHAQVVDAAAAGSRTAMLVNAALLDHDVQAAVEGSRVRRPAEAAR